MNRKQADEIIKRIKVGSKREWLHVGDMKVDPRAQRLLRPTWVKRHVSLFDANQLGVVCVSRRHDGSLWIIDGQHRVELIRAVGWGDQALDCEVFDGLSIQQEAALFLSRNDKISVRTFDKFMAGITAAEPVNAAVVKIVQGLGLKIAEGDSEGSIGAVTALGHIYRGASIASEREGAQALTAALRTLLDAWGRAASNFTGAAVEALGLIYLRYGSKVDREALTQWLAKLPGGVGKLIQQGRNVREAHGGTLAYNIADVVVIGYNRKRRSKLERWRA